MQSDMRSKTDEHGRMYHKWRNKNGKVEKIRKNIFPEKSITEKSGNSIIKQW